MGSACVFQALIPKPGFVNTTGMGIAWFFDLLPIYRISLFINLFRLTMSIALSVSRSRDVTGIGRSLSHYLGAADGADASISTKGVRGREPVNLCTSSSQIPYIVS